MSRIEHCFHQLKQQKKKALIPYITAGDRSFDETVALLHTLVKGGAHMLEVGLPFSDPVADGPVIEKAHHRAVANGETLQSVLQMIVKFRQIDTTTPIILMGYLNPIEIMGYSKFAELAEKAEIDGLLVVDCPPEESAPLLSILKKHHMDMIFLIAPNTPDDRIKKIVNLASGYLYYISLKGVTGDSRAMNIEHIKKQVNKIKNYTSLPIAVGFGVKNGETAAQISEFADAVIVGTAFVKTLEEDRTPAALEKIKEQVQNICSAIDL